MQEFFQYARLREAVRITREECDGQFPYTDDPILTKYRFTNVFREDDAVTRWFRFHVRDTLHCESAVLLATVVFRWFNRVSTGKAIFIDRSPARGNRTAWSIFLETGDTEAMLAAILNRCGEGPYVTGAYIVKTPDNMSKLRGVLQCLEWFWERSRDGLRWDAVADHCLEQGGEGNMRWVWDWLCQHSYMGPFMAYEVVCDLRYTALLDKAPDRLTWANPGPGAKRGIHRLVHNTERGKAPPGGGWEGDFYQRQMQRLLAESRERQNWPWQDRPWEMREVEHTLCEFDKYQRVKLGEGKPRQVFRHG